MNAIHSLYKEFRAGLEVRPGPAGPPFFDAWQLTADLTNLAGCRLMESRMGASLTAAGEVQLHLARFERVASISRDMPLSVSAATMRSLRAMGRLLEETPHSHDVGDFLMLAAPITDDYVAYVSQSLGREARPVLHALSVVAWSGSIMAEQLGRTVPFLAESGR